MKRFQHKELPGAGTESQDRGLRKHLQERGAASVRVKASVEKEMLRTCE